MEGDSTDDLIESLGGTETCWPGTDDKHIDGPVQSQG